MSIYQSKYTFCMRARTTRRRFRLQKQTLYLAAMLAAILDFSVRHHLCQFMPAVSESKENGEHFGIWHILLYVGGPGSQFFNLVSHPTTRATIVLFYRILTTATALTAMTLPRVILQGTLIDYYPADKMRLLKWRQRVILLARVILLGNMTEYYAARNMLSTNVISSIAYEY